MQGCHWQWTVQNWGQSITVPEEISYGLRPQGCQATSQTCLQVICMPRQLHALASPAQPGFDQQGEANLLPLPQQTAQQQLTGAQSTRIRLLATSLEYLASGSGLQGTTGPICHVLRELTGTDGWTHIAFCACVARQHRHS